MENSEEANIIGPSLREFLVEHLEYAGNKILEWAEKLKTLEITFKDQAASHMMDDVP